MTRAKIEVMLRKEKEKPSSTTACLDLKPSYSIEVAPKPHPSGYSVPIQKFDGRRGNMRDMWYIFLIQWALLPTMLTYALVIRTP